MTERPVDIKNLATGIAVLLIGLAIALYSAFNYELGSLRQMGRGMFPMGVGIVMALCGAIIAVPALFQGGARPSVELRPAIAITAAVSLYAATVHSLGLAPATLLMTLVSIYADSKVGILVGLLLGVALSLASYLVFGLLLGMTITFVAWPF